MSHWPGSFLKIFSVCFEFKITIQSYQYNHDHNTIPNKSVFQDNYNKFTYLLHHLKNHTVLFFKKQH